jgi:hypothetical protein
MAPACTGGIMPPDPDNMLFFAGFSSGPTELVQTMSKDDRAAGLTITAM